MQRQELLVNNLIHSILDYDFIMAKGALFDLIDDIAIARSNLSKEEFFEYVMEYYDLGDYEFIVVDEEDRINPELYNLEDEDDELE